MVSNQTGLEVGYLAATHPGRLGHLYSPRGERGPWHFLPYALDNGAYRAFKKGEPWDEGRWRRLVLWAAMAGQRPEWVLVPDVVGNRAATIENWAKYVGEVERFGFRPAFAVQDGMTFDDVPDKKAVLFLGGSTAWKVKAIEPWCARFPGRVHVARVNTWGRLVKCWRAGAVSIDGTGWFHKKQKLDLMKFLRETSERAAA